MDDQRDTTVERWDTGEDGGAAGDGPVDDGVAAAGHDHRADGPPSSDEVHAADRFLADQDPEDAARVAAHHHEMDLLGAEVRGEGQID